DRRMAAALAASPPYWPPGTRLAYHALTFGWLCGELVRRVDGRSVGTFFAEEVAAPLGLDVWIGLPPQLETRIAPFRRAPGYGFGLRPDLAALGPPPDAFGHSGSGGSRHGAWPALHVGFSYAMNELRGAEEDDRARRLLDALHEAVAGR